MTDTTIKTSANSSGAWIGIDFGTTNCAAAVYDGTRGGSKWMRLQDIAEASGGSNKHGRIVPSVVLLATERYVMNDRATRKNNINAKKGKHHYEYYYWQNVSDLFKGHGDLYALVGASAINFYKNHMENNDDAVEDPTVLSAALIRSVKRRLLEEQRDEESCIIDVTPLGLTKSISVNAVMIVAVILRAIRLASNEYLQRNLFAKHLKIPGDAPPCRNCCIGVPAAATIRYRNKCLTQAAGLAGFASVSTVTESTAAAMAYGLMFTNTTTTTAQKQQQTILVFDMGGGTTDVTIAERSNHAAATTTTTTTSNHDTDFQVVLTQGNNRLGGDDMDQAVLQIVANKLSSDAAVVHKDDDMITTNSQLLLQKCRHAKEALCGDGTASASPSATVNVIWQGMSVTITQDEFNHALQPILHSARLVVESALQRYTNSDDDGNNINNKHIDEVILIGGASRVPAIRAVLKEIFTELELCVSINAMSAVAQGCAVAAAMHSGKVPLHELRSALMLDTSPHPIGVLTTTTTTTTIDNRVQQHFVEILPRDASLPAASYATFQLADIHQPGVTLKAVEQIGDNAYSALGEFTFLLHKLNADQIAALQGTRSVDIGMTLKTNGEFVVSIFDPHDPDHIRKRERYVRAKQGRQNADEGDNRNNTLDYKVNEKLSKEQISLIIACIALFALYVAAKLAFQKDVLLMD